MTRQKATQGILGLWLLATAVIALFIFSQVLTGKYGDDATVPFNWVSAQISPVLGLLLAATFSSPPQKWKTTPVTDNRYMLAIATSGIQIAAITLTLLIEPFLSATSFQLFDSTILYLSLWQGVVTASVGGLVFDGR